MPRHEPHPGGDYTKLVAVKLNDEAIAVLDKLRGQTPRSSYFRELLRAEARRQPRLEPEQKEWDGKRKVGP